MIRVHMVSSSEAELPYILEYKDSIRSEIGNEGLYIYDKNGVCQAVIAKGYWVYAEYCEEPIQRKAEG